MMSFSCQDAEGCKKIRADLSKMKLERGSALQKADRDQLFAEGAAVRIRELETLLLASSGATIIGRDTTTIKKLQAADLVQRSNLDRIDKERIAALAEVDRLEKLCRINKIDTTPVRSASPSEAAVKMGNLWGAFTGNQGV